jgi:hypothetical protein
MSSRLYQISGRFKSFLFVIAIAIIGFLLFYTQQLVETLRGEARQIMEFYAQFYARAADDATGAELNFIFEEIIKRTDFPIIQSDANSEPVGWKGIEYAPGDTSKKTLESVRKLMNAMKKEIEPIPIKYGEIVLGYLYYGDSNSIRQLQWLPYIEIFIVSLFILVGFFGFNSIRRSEQQFIWVGMAKETAHQLGTPISSLMGWTEVLKTRKVDGEKGKILTDMQLDIERLEKVAQRFSKIGSKTDLHEQNIDEMVHSVLRYFERRLPQMGKKVHLIYENSLQKQIPFNPELLEWVFENLIKNALDAIDKPEGEIKIHVGAAENKKYHAIIDSIDSGKGMDAQTKKNLFKPGFSTKKRGWGLGLSLARRIVEENHKGRLLVKETQIDKGTTMRMMI